jgi:hypothetical protein
MRERERDCADCKDEVLRAGVGTTWMGTRWTGAGGVPWPRSSADAGQLLWERKTRLLPLEEVG